MNKPQFKPIITTDPGTKRWMMELGRAIVFFGVLERLMLDWAALLRCDPKLLARHQKADMKRIARLLHKAVQASDRGVPLAARSRAPAERESAQVSAEAGRSRLPGTAASAAAKPVRECVPSQNGLVDEPPQRQSAKGRLGMEYDTPFQSTSVTSSPSTR